VVAVVVGAGEPGDRLLGGRAVAELGLTDLVPTQDVVADLYAWASVTPLPAVSAVSESAAGTRP